MSEYTPHLAPLVVMAFLGSVSLIGLSLLVLLYSAVRRSKFLGAASAGTAVSVILVYAGLLCAVSLTSRDQVLPPGGWKRFCEADCHIAYSIAGVNTASLLGPELQQTSANGQALIVRLKVWFDPSTISPHRGNGPLMTNPRRIVLVDDTSRSFAPWVEGEAALARLEGPAAPLVQPLRPGDSFTTPLVFDVPAQTHGLRLLVTDDDPIWRFVIGDEDTPFHKKIYLDLGPMPALSGS